ncbi:MAG: TorF family putative porin [Woeseia sp.]
MTFSRMLPRAAVCLLALAAGPVSVAADVTGYAVVTTDYVFRGATYSNGHGAAQAGIDVALDSGLYGGLWASTIDIEGGSTRRDAEVNYYVGYNRDMNADWTVGISVVAYTFPGAEGPFDYDYNEITAVANFRDRAWIEYAYSPDLFHSSRSTHNLELYAEWPLPRSLLLGAGAGYYDVSDLTGASYSYWQAGVTRPFEHFSIDLRLHAASREVPIISAPDRAGSRLVLSLRIPFVIASR